MHEKSCCGSAMKQQRMALGAKTWSSAWLDAMGLRLAQIPRRGCLMCFAAAGNALRSLLPAAYARHGRHRRHGTGRYVTRKHTGVDVLRAWTSMGAKARTRAKERAPRTGRCCYGSAVTCSSRTHHVLQPLGQGSWRTSHPCPCRGSGETRRQPWRHRLWQTSTRALSGRQRGLCQCRLW